MPKHMFALHGAMLFAMGILMSAVSYDFAITTGNVAELAVAFLSLPMLYFGLFIIKEYEFAPHGLVVRQSVFRDSFVIPYGSIRDVRLTFIKYPATPASYTLTIVHDGGAEKVGFGFSIDEGFLKSLSDRVGGHKISRAA